MPDVINVKAVEHLATVLGKPAAEVQSMLLTAEADPTKHVVGKIGEILPADAVLGLTEFKTKADFETWKQNYQKQSYDNGKIAASDMLIKEAKRKYGIGADGDGNKDFDWFITEHKKKTLAEANVAPDKRITELETDKTALQGKVQEWETKYNSLSGELEQVKSSSQATLLIQTEVNALDIDADPTLLSAQREMLTAAFHNAYTLRKDGAITVVVEKATNEVVKDSLLKPESLANVVSKFASMKVKLKSVPDKGRGASSSTTTGGSDADLAKINTSHELMEYYKANNINPYGLEARNIQARVMTLNKSFGKKPA